MEEPSCNRSASRRSSLIPEPIVPGFDVTLEPGLNMISIPLMPAEPYTAKSLAEMVGSTVVIQLNAATQSFVGYTVADSSEGFSIDGGQGYIVNTPAGGMVKFTGDAWDNQPEPEEPAVEEAPAEEVAVEPAAEEAPAEEVAVEPAVEEVAAEEVAAEEVAVEVAEEVAAEEVAEEPVAEEEVAAVEVAEEVAAEEVAEEVAAEEVAAEEVAEEVAAEVAARSCCRTSCLKKLLLHRLSPLSRAHGRSSLQAMSAVWR